MNLIVCAQDCMHQSEGYCALNQITSLSTNNEAKCGYYEKSTDNKNALSPLAEEAQGIR